MIHVVLCRIDDRLIHGQVVTQWVSYVGGCDSAWIVDDGVKKDPFISSVLTMAAPRGLAVQIFSLEEAVTAAGDPKHDKKRVILLMKVPATAARLLEAGLPITHLNVGGMGSNPNRRSLHRNISASPEEIAQLQAIAAKGVTVELRPVPADGPMSLEAAVKKGAK